ncbi:MAG: glycosyltransferase family 2 protein [Chloroflexota bacterium]
MKANEDLVSVIIPVYNHGRYLAEAIESALGQSYRALEVIVVDDGSTDDSGKVAEGFGSSIRYHRHVHAGISATRNRGVELARGAYLSHLDADDLWTERKLELQVAALEADPGLDMVFGLMEQFFSPEVAESLARRLRCPEGATQAHIPGTMLIRRAPYERVGPIETDWRVGGFISWYAMAVDMGLREVMLPEVLLRRRIHGANQGIRERRARGDYVRMLKASLDRRRKAGLLS